MTEPSNSAERAPLGSWAALYAVVVVAAVGLMALLYWFTTAYDIPLEGP